MDGLDLSNVPFDLIINILNIVVFYLIIRLLVYKPVKKFLSARRERIEKEQKTLDEASKELESRKEAYEAQMEEAEHRSKELLHQSREEADRNATEILNAARAEADKLIADANLNIATREKEAINGMKDDVVELSVSIASKLIARNLNDEDNKRLAADFFEKELGSMKQG